MPGPLEGRINQPLGGFTLRGEDSEFERRKQKALDDLRASVSPKVWDQIREYVQAMLTTATPSTLNGVLEDIKVECKLSQDIEDLKNKEEEAHEAHMKDTLELSPEVTEKLHGPDPLHSYTP